MVAPEHSLSASVRAVRPAQDPTTIELSIDGRIDRSDAARLGRRVRDLLDARDANLIVCDVGSLVEPDAAAVDALCRMRLAARRRGCQLTLRDATPELADLLFLMGLTDVMPAARRSDIRADRQPEEWEHPGRVQEERDPADPPA